MDYYSTDPLFNVEMLMLIIAVIIIIGTFLVFAYIINVYLPFKEERDYIKMEMESSFGKKDYSYWKRELRRLYLSLIPLIGRFFR